MFVKRFIAKYTQLKQMELVKSLGGQLIPQEN